MSAIETARKDVLSLLFSVIFGATFAFKLETLSGENGYGLSLNFDFLRWETIGRWIAIGSFFAFSVSCAAVFLFSINKPGARIFGKPVPNELFFLIFTILLGLSPYGGFNLARFAYICSSLVSGYSTGKVGSFTINDLIVFAIFSTITLAFRRRTHARNQLFPSI